MIDMALSMADPRTVGQRMKAWRETQGLSQRAAAERAGLSQFVWSIYERDQGKDTTLKVAVALVEVTKGTDHAIALDMFPREAA